MAKLPRLGLVLGLIIGLTAGTILGVYVSGAFSETKTVGGTVTITGTQGLALNTTTLSFGGMSAGQNKTVAFTMKNVGCCLLNLSYVLNPGTLPGATSLNLGTYPPYNGLPNSLPFSISANQTVTYLLRLSLGGNVVFGRTYSFNVTITGYTA